LATLPRKNVGHFTLINMYIFNNRPHELVCGDLDVGGKVQ